MVNFRLQDKYISENLLTELKDSIVKQIQFSMRRGCFDFV